MNNNLKYARTWHLPYSPGTTNDDKKLESDSHLIGKEVVLTLKLDGENCSMTSERIWARSLDSQNHPSRNWVKNFWENIRYDIPEGFRICGENLFAKHSIYYESLPSYFVCFNIWIGDECLSWDETKTWCELIGLELVPVLYRGIYDKEILIKEASSSEKIFGGEREGIVGRFPERFKIQDFKENVFKWVRKGHVQTSDHWMYSEIIPNKLEIQNV